MVEVWKDMVDYEDLFQVSNLGNIFSKRTNKLLKQTKIKTGYMTFATKIGGRNGISKCFKVHREVAKAFLKAFLKAPTEEQLEYANNTVHKVVNVNHKDGNKLNNVITNLEWMTNKENTQYYLTELGGLEVRAEYNKRNIKLTDKEIIEIIEIIEVKKLASKNLTQREIAHRYDVSRGVIARAIKGFEWLEK